MVRIKKTGSPDPSDLDDGEDDTDDSDRSVRVNPIVAIGMVVGVLTAIVGLFFLADLALTLLGVGLVFAAFAGQAALERFRLRFGGD